MSGQILNGAAMAAMAGSGPAALTVASPMNDTQLVALVAAQRCDESADVAVDWALDVVANAFVGVASGELGRRIKALARAAQESAGE